MTKTNWLTMGRTGVAGLALVAAWLLAYGCQKTAQQEFPPDDQVRAPMHFAQAQAAAGAGRDATLYGHHFDAGGQLNSLGRAKLDLMLQSAVPHGPLTVYLDAPADAGWDQRAGSVTAYLKDHGLAESQIKVQAGANPAVTSPAAQDLARLPRTESGGAGGGTASPAPEGQPASPEAPAGYK